MSNNKPEFIDNILQNTKLRSVEQYSLNKGISKKITDTFFSEDDIEKLNSFTNKYGDIAKTIENITDSISNFFEEANDKIRENFPYKSEYASIKYYSDIEDEKNFCNELRSDDNAKTYLQDKVLKQFTSKIEQISSNQQTTSFLDDTKDKDKDKESEQIEYNGLKKYVLDSWGSKFAKKSEKWILNEIDKQRKAFLKELFKKMSAFDNLFKNLGSFINEPGRLWDMSAGAWQNVNFSILEQYQKMLENDKSLQELSNLLGKYRESEIEYEIKLLKEQKIITTKINRPAKSGSVIGNTYGNEIQSALPQDLGLLAHPIAKQLFYKKIIQNQITQYNKNIPEQHKSVIEEEKEHKKAKQKDKGPFVLIVDTSGSMHGLPERIAKIIAFVLSKTAYQTKRKVFIINFSTSIECFELGDVSGDIIELIKFLSMSFNGGTDINPAFEKAIEVLKTDSYERADTLLISDGIFPTADNEIEKEVALLKEKDNKFYSLMIGASYNNDAIKLFDENWSWSNSDNFEKLIEKINKIQNRKP